MKFDQIDQDAVNAIRALSIDMIQHAHSGHPGMPLDAAPMLYVAYKHHLKVDPKYPKWFNRDRFVLSAGHGSSMLYALLHLAGYPLTMSDLKAFRTLGSKTPGHPELKTPGVDAATGPLGQGLGMAVGMAMAEKHLAAKYNQADFPIVDNKVYVIVSDGDLMEGISHEAASLAGHLKLANLVVLYDSNGVTLDSSAKMALGDDAGGRFKAYGWHYSRVANGNNLVALDQAMTDADNESERPTLIEVKTTLGYGSPYAGQHSVHGNPLTATECRETMHKLGWEHAPFTIPDEIYQRFAEISVDGEQQYKKWRQQFTAYQARYPELAKSFSLNKRSDVKVPTFAANYQAGDMEATRTTVHQLIQKSADTELNFWGGSADLSSSNKTYFEHDIGFESTDYSQKNIFFGVREFAQAAAVNGIMLYGGSQAFGSTFFVFADYMKNALRMAALMHIPSLFIFSHDSIALGQDGPTHQPIEQLDSFRAVPGLTVFRPADAVETTQIWQYMLNEKHGPIMLALSRQELPVLAGSLVYGKAGTLKGAYVISPSIGAQPNGILLATGSEVSLAIEVQKLLHEHDQDVQVVSVPSMELFEQQPQAYRDQVLPPSIRQRMSIELGSTLSWGKYTGIDGLRIGLDEFGASGDAAEIMQTIGFTADQIAQRYLQHFKK